MDRAEYRAAAEALNRRPVGEDLPGQKFKRGSRVHICKDLPKEMRHFESDLDAIVDHTYAQKFGGSDVDSYALILINGEDGSFRFSAWYRENQLTLVSDDTEAGLKLIAQYRATDREEEE